MSKIRKLTIEPVKKSVAAAAVVNFRPRSAATTVRPNAEKDHAVKTSTARSERFRLQPVKHN